MPARNPAVASSNIVAQLKAVTFSYRNTPNVLENVSLTIPGGEFRYLVGPSGAGKSSLLRLLFMDTYPTDGSVLLFGSDVQKTNAKERATIRQKIGIVFQDFRLLNNLSLADNVALPRLISGENLQVAREEALELIRWVGLDHRINSAPQTLSGGERQRIAIARAVINRPKLLIGDEPTGSVDDAMGDRLLTLFEYLNRIGTTIILATHSKSLIDRFPHPVITLEDGRLIED
ncbi:MAG: cell division ATP-binding protein FtsE [Alphaproteobacteria bacterium]|jgi:cell division transport system ATP-binding protein